MGKVEDSRGERKPWFHMKFSFNLASQELQNANGTKIHHQQKAALGVRKNLCLYW